MCGICMWVGRRGEGGGGASRCINCLYLQNFICCFYLLSLFADFLELNSAATYDGTHRPLMTMGGKHLQ